MGGKRAPPQQGEPKAMAAPQPPRKVNLLDGPGLKAALDDCAREVVLGSGYEEDVSVTNNKILMGLVAISLALLAQFGPGKFPANWWMVAACVAGYGLMTLAINAYTQRVEGDAFLICKPRKSGGPSLRVSSQMARFDDKYTLVMAGKTPGKGSPLREVSWSDSVASFFHADSYLSEDAFRPRVETLLEDYEGLKRK